MGKVWRGGLARPGGSSLGQGLTFVHLPAKLERFVWDRGCAEGLCSRIKGVLEGV